MKHPWLKAIWLGSPNTAAILLTLATLVLGDNQGWAAGAEAGSAASTPPSGSGFRFGAINDRSLGLWEGKRAVFVYNHGIISQPGVPADRARSSYIHPLYGLEGETLTDDFPKDHYHHRGLFWAWPHVRIEGKEYDLWMLKGVSQKFRRWLAQKTEGNSALLGVENTWEVEARPVMEELVWMRAHPARPEGRLIELDFTWIPLERPITLAGAEGKSYGGLTLRFAPGTNTTITVPSGRTTKDLPMTKLPWADLTRLWTGGGITSGAAIFVHPSHPEFPPEWLTRHYGVLCLGWPGVSARSFEAGKAIQCRYAVWIHRGLPSVTQLQQAYEAYASSSARPLIPQPER